MSKDYNNLTDFKLISLIKQGDIKAFEQLFERYQLFVKNIARKYTKKDNLVEEILQNTFLKVFLNIDQFNKNAKFTSWLYTICKNEGRMYLRDKKKYKNFKNIKGPMDSFGKKNKSIDEKVELLDIKKKVKDAISKLPKHYQSVLNKVAFEDKTYKEIANQLNLTESQVKSRIYRARQKLKKMLEKYIKHTDY